MSDTVDIQAALNLTRDDWERIASMAYTWKRTWENILGPYLSDVEPIQEGHDLATRIIEVLDWDPDR